MTDQQQVDIWRIVARITASVVAIAVIVSASFWVTRVINSTEPAAEMEGLTRESAALVETIGIEIGTHRPTIRVLGVVEAARDISLSPRVSGEILSIESTFLPGGIVAAGAPLVELDRADYETALTVRVSERMQVEASLAIEQGRQDVAIREFELLGEDLDRTNRALVLREPQIETIRAQLEAARAEERRAELDLERTTIRAPFDALVLTRTANLGSQVDSGSALARLVGIHEYWVLASVPMRDLPWIRFSGDDAGASAVSVRHRTAWPDGSTRDGLVGGLVGAVNDQTRLARVLITVPDPIALETEGPALMLGSIVEVTIEGKSLQNVARVSRDLVRQGDTVWLMSDGALEVRAVSVRHRDGQYAYIDSGLGGGERIVVTTLASLEDGTPLREIAAAAPPATGAQERISNE